jgi:hypothetical protein
MRQVARHHHPVEQRRGQPVDLDDQHPGLRRGLDLAGPAADDPHHLGDVGVVAAGVRDPADERADRRHHDRDQPDRLDAAVQVDARIERDAEVHDAELAQQPADQDADRADQHRDPGQDPAHHQADHGQQDHQPEDRQPAVTADLRQRPERDDQRDQRGEPAEDHRLDTAGGTAQVEPDRAALPSVGENLLGWFRHQVLRTPVRACAPRAYESRRDSGVLRHATDGCDQGSPGPRSRVNP